MLCRPWLRKRESVAQFMIPECYVPGHPRREHTLTAARTVYLWPTMRVYVDAYVAKCVKGAQHKGTVPRPALILEYLLPDGSWDVVSIDLLQLHASHQGSRYLLVCVDHLARYVVFASVKYKSAKSIVHTLITHIICPYSTCRVLLSDNRTEFRSQLLAEIYKQFCITQSFTVIYHPAINGLVERANRKILDVLRPVIS